MIRAVFDLNVILDVLLRREPHTAASASALDSVAAGAVEGYIAGHAVTTLAYLLQRELGATKSHTVLAQLMEKLRVGSVTDSVIRRALSLNFRDFEDAVTAAVAQDSGASAIVTRNVADFRKSPVPAVPPALFRPVVEG